MNDPKPLFIDLFAGAGGLSLGLMQAGWRGLFAVEKSPMAFETLSFNLIDRDDKYSFAWPTWLPKQPIDIQVLVRDYKEQLRGLEGIELVAGGPPCQGYSMSGRRERNDERNTMIDHYLEFVGIVRPRFLLVENVWGFSVPFREHKTDEGFNASEYLRDRLAELGYISESESKLMAKNFGVPQLRPRFFLVAIREDEMKNGKFRPLKLLAKHQYRSTFLAEKQLPADRPVSLGEAISDLEQRHGTISCSEEGMSNFQQGNYGPVASVYQGLLRRGRDGQVIEDGVPADSHRFPNHKKKTVEGFRQLQAHGEPGFNLSSAKRRELGLSQHRVVLCHRDQPCHTVTTMPDDMVHYAEPRVPTAREYARIQSFPDWFEFKAAYTTGGKERRNDVPRYTQIANAVPPLLAEAIGKALLQSREALVDPGNFDTVINYEEAEAEPLLLPGLA